MVEEMLELYAYNSLTSSVPQLQARACSLYNKFGDKQFKNEQHLLAATNGSVVFMQNSNLVVRVEGALAMSKLLSHEKAVDLVRPNLGNVLKAFL